MAKLIARGSCGRSKNNWEAKEIHSNWIKYFTDDSWIMAGLGEISAVFIRGNLSQTRLIGGNLKGSMAKKLVRVLV